MYTYHAFKLNILSELTLPELFAQPLIINENPDVHIHFGKVSSAGLEHALIKGVTFQSNEHSLWLHIPHIARYLVSEGKRITIEPLIHANEDSVRAFLLGSCMGALLMQRDLFLLHANAIKINDVCVSFAGQSGMGKSTLSAAFLQEGNSILADDICAINQNGEVIPSFPEIRLWADSSQHLAIETDALRQIRPNIEKFALPLGVTQFHTHELPLKVVYILESHNKETFEFLDLTHSQKFNPLKNHTYRAQFLKDFGNNHTHIMNLGLLASKVNVVKVKRPNYGFYLNQLVDLIKTDLKQKGFNYA